MKRKCGLTPEGLTESMSASPKCRLPGCVGLHLDDFGTGYSSLSHLRQLPITTIKIDRTFIREMNLETNREIVRVIVSLAQTLKLGLICEGVETQQQLEWLQEIGCHKLQGYLFSKPVPAQAALRLLEHSYAVLRDRV